MAQERESIHGQWSSRMAFILAATGSAVGLGNIWKFPYITGVNGGGAFVLVYLLCIAAIGIPIMIAEIMMGRRGRRSPINTLRYLAEEAGRHRGWQVMGWLGIVVGFLILSYYSVIAGWALAYVLRAMEGAFSGQSPEAVAGLFGQLVSTPELLLLWHTLFMVMTMWIVARGVRSGLEQAVRYMMPALFVLLLLLVGYAMNTGYFQQGLAFLFTPDFSKITPNGVLMAMGHSFFTLSLGMGAILVYGSYMPKGASIVKTTLVIALADTSVALLAGMAIFPIVFSYGLEPGAGPGLVFKTLPIAFGQMPGGALFGTFFFVLLVLAAWTSSISIAEPVVAWLVESHGLTRRHAAWWVGGGAWLLGIGSVLSFNLWSSEPYLLFGKTFFDLLDYLTSNILLPAGGLLVAIFAGWIMRRESVREELGLKDALLFRIWRFLVRFVAPVAVLFIFLHATEIIKFE
ncbi:MAG TPA: sodium-dependent transporter [Gammaproteobacteria bacterium]